MNIVHHLEDKEREEENVIKHCKKVTDEIKTNIDTLIPKNKNGKFLMDEKFNNTENKRSIQEIINNFTKADSVIEKYISEFQSDDKKKKNFSKNKVLF